MLFGQQIVKYGGELGLHGYNHEPLHYEAYPADSTLLYDQWYSYEESVAALSAAVDEFERRFPDYNLNCYVPPSNIIDAEGVRAVKEAMGEPVIISGMYLDDDEDYVVGQDIKYEDGVIYIPRFSSDSFLNDDTKLNIASAMSMYGVVSHFIHPDDVMDPERNNGYSWEEMRVEFADMIGFIGVRYPFLEYETATETAEKVVDWCDQDYLIDYQDEYIEIKAMNDSDSMSFILRTEKELVESDDYEFIRCGILSYYVKLNKPEVKIMLKGQS